MAEKVKITGASDIYETKPWGYLDQPDFLNQVVEVKTDLTPNKLLDFLKRVEKKMGRETSFKYGPRLIDLDILFYGERVVHTRRLDIPHPKLAERAFVLVPLAEIAPEVVHPVAGKTICCLREILQSTISEVKRIGC